MKIAQGDCLLVNVRFKEIDILEGMFAQPRNECGYLHWVVPQWLRMLRKQVQFNQIKNTTAWTLR